jgi:hypothetical protein
MGEAITEDLGTRFFGQQVDYKSDTDGSIVLLSMESNQAHEFDFCQCMRDLFRTRSRSKY